MGDYAAALALTLAIEVPLYVACLALWASRPWSSAVGIGVAVNVVTHPMAFLMAYPVLDGALGVTVALAVTELAVTLAEACMLRCWGVEPVKALWTSGLANVTSLVVGSALV
jgi:hypothetical protein